MIDDYEYAAERDCLLGALADALLRKDSGVTAWLIEQLVACHGADENIDLPLAGALRHFRDWGRDSAVFETCRMVADYAPRDGAPRDIAMETLLNLARKIGGRDIRKAQEGLFSVLYQAAEDHPFHAAAVEELFALADDMRPCDPEQSRVVISGILRNADRGSVLADRALDALIALATYCYENERGNELAREITIAALLALPDGDPRAGKMDELLAVLEDDGEAARAAAYRDSAAPLPPDGFLQKFSP